MPDVLFSPRLDSWRPWTSPVCEPFGYAEAQRYPRRGSREISVWSCAPTASSGWALQTASLHTEGGEQESREAIGR